MWIIAIVLAGCMSRETNLEDITEQVESKGKGVIIDIEPGQKK
jgi:hypothetical protein